MKKVKNNIEASYLKFIYLLIAIGFAFILKAESELSSNSLLKNNSVNKENIDSLIQYLKSSGIDYYEWEINKNNSWEDLHIFLPAAKVAGISVSINLLPPTMTPPVCDTCSYSEPFRLDYMKWAQEIAKLSLRYSNLKSFTIKYLQENVDLNYFTYSYLDSLRNVGKSINPKLEFNSEAINFDTTAPAPPTNFTATLQNINVNPNLPYELAPKIYYKWQNWEMHTIANKQRASIVENPSYDEVNSSPSVGRVRIFYDDDYSGIANGRPRSEFTLYPNFNLNHGHTYKITWDDYLTPDFIGENSTPGPNYNYLVQLKASNQDSPPLVLYQDGDEYAFRQAIYLDKDSYYDKTSFGSISADRGKWQHWELNVYMDSTNSGWATLYHNGIKVDSNAHRTYPRIPPNSSFYLKIGAYKYNWRDHPKVQDSIVRYIDNIIIKNITTGEESVTTFGEKNGNTKDSIAHYIDLQWANPLESDHDSTYVFSSIINDSSTANLIAFLNKSTTTYRDTLKLERIRYYWLKTIDKNKNVSSFSSIATDTSSIYVPNK